MSANRRCSTPCRVLGIYNTEECQIIFLDTPGIHKSQSPLNNEMVRIARESLTEADVIAFLVDVTYPLPQKENTPTRYLEGNRKPVILLLNKIDLVSKDKLLPLIKAYDKLYPFSAIIPISALNNDGIEVLITEILKHLPEGPRLYPEDIPTDATERFIVAEIIREKVFLLTDEEIPYSTAVTVESFKENEERASTTIHASIIIEKSSQKGIIIGKQGRKLTEIGTAARKEIEGLLGQKVILKLWVKVKKNWTKNSNFLRELGL